ncbi:MAG: hypothetical protein PHD13_01190 [Methanocellales archaeon]|nr:hypothetical protein [Methanocellales archaeon]MDD3292237.1 hypothetical protein [Methanocellales archaeon]MDD5234777.1 hypothetical protein [Methanocellales archaeon]MDD5484853.1 hypothetical protein [Methanocellales archaeon]
MSVAYEHDKSKIWELSENLIVLTAGDALDYVDLFEQVMTKIPLRARLPILEVTEIVKEEYLELRGKKIEDEFFKPKGLSMEWFYENQNILNETLALTLDRKIEEYDFDLFLIIAGVDQKGAHIYFVHTPDMEELMGTYSCYDSMGYCTVGTGDRHSDMVFVASRYTSSFSLKNALYVCYEAKKKAELAVGVGKNFTDIIVIDKEGVTHLNETVKELDEIYKQSLELDNSKQSELRTSISSLDVKELQKE